MASSYYEECRRYFGIILLVFVLFDRGFGAGTGHGKAENNGCSSVKLAYGLQGLNGQDVPLKMIHGGDLRVCAQGVSCCTPLMEAKLQTQSRDKYNSAMADKLELLRHTFITRTAKFDLFFTELLDNSKRDLHDMFVRTYGLLYQKNSHVFTDLFKDLREYYKGRDLNLLDVLDNFFSTLMQKMFVLLNVQYEFDDAYLQCVTEHMDELQPFGDVPQKLSVQVKRAFVAARTFVQGLAIGRDVILEISKMQSSQSCERAMMKMFFCPYCQALPNVPPCNGYCMNVMKGCLAQHADIDHAWNSYITELMKVADRLEGPFNIESVVDPIDVKISDGIMNFQENGGTVTERVFQGCGQPQLDRTRRNADPQTSYETSVPFDWQSERKGQYVRPTTAAGTSLDRLVRDIREKVEITSGFWKGLPDAICNDAAAPLDQQHQCWNGQSRAPYLPDIVGYGLVNQVNNPEVDVDIHRPNAVLNQQILQLKIISNKLKNAYNGLDVDWIDDTEVDSFSGSGSGSGSGYSIYPDGSNEGIDFQPTSSKPIPTKVPRNPPRNTPAPLDNLLGSSTQNQQSWIVVIISLFLVAFSSCRWHH